jgi:tetratricopeptide (TPR) repeat protein
LKSIYYWSWLLCICGMGVCIGQKSQIDSLKRVLIVVKIDTSKVNIYNNLASHFKESNPDSTTYYADKAISVSRKINYGFGLANAYINKGNADIILGNYPAALNHFKNAQSEYEELLDDASDDKVFKNGLARAYASAGVVYSEQSNYYMALEHYEKALKLYREVGQQINISKALNNIGIVYKSQSNYPKALEYLSKALQIQMEIGEQSAAVTLTNIGVIHFENGNPTKALENYKKAERLFDKIDNNRGFALLNTYLGDYFREQNAELAIEYYQKSLDLYEGMSNKFGASLALYRLGLLYLDRKSYSEAMVYATKSLEYAKEIGVLDQTYHSEKLVSDLYGYLNNPAKSLVHYKNYISARDSITNQENNKKFAMAEMNFEYKQKEALLTEKAKRHNQLTIFTILGTLLLIVLSLVIYNRMQVKRRLTLQKEVAEYEQKALHLQMNPHFVFNCLSSISSFIVQNGTDSALKYLSKFSKLMRLTLEYSKGSLIPIDKEIESLQNYLELEQLRFHNKFDFTITSSNNVEFNMGLPPLLIQPFVENAILHGMVPKEEKGKIEVSFDVADKQLVCTITDDGIGIAESKLLKENSMTAHKSMALEITKKRLEIMESTTAESAQIDIAELENNSKKTGTKVILRLPIQYIQ